MPNPLLKITTLVKIYEDEVRKYKSSGSTCHCKPTSLTFAESQMKEYVEGLLQQLQTTSNPTSWGHQQAIVELLYFNTKGVLSELAG